MEARSVAREPAIDGFLEGGHRPQPVGAGERGPWPANFSQDAVHRSGALGPTAVPLDGPRRTVPLFARQPITRQHASSLVGDGQHTAGPVTPADPARHPSSIASSSVEDEHKLRIVHATI